MSIATIAVDFDHTISNAPYPHVGMPNVELIKYLIAFRENGGKVILWTCREGEALERAVKFCNDVGLHFDAVNDNLPGLQFLYGSNPRKVAADLYIDDNACQVDDFVKKHCKKRRSVRGIRIRG